MYINDEYAVECIMSILCDIGNTFQTPNDYLTTYTYEDSRSITLEDLRDALKEIIGGSHETTKY